MNLFTSKKSSAIARFTWAILLLFMLGVASGADSTKQAPSINYPALSVEKLTELAEKGDAIAQNRLGIRYEKGLGVKKDLRQAAAWYKKAALQNHAIAQSNYAVCLLKMTNDRRIIKEAVEWLEKSAAQNNPQGLSNLALAYSKGWAGPKNLDKAAELYKRAVAAGNANTLPKLQKLADAGNPAGQFHLATLLETGRGIKKDLTKARELYQKAADQNHTRAIAVLGLFNEFGVSGPKDMPKAIRLYQTASERGDAQAQNALGKCYFHGNGVKKNAKQAAVLFEKAAKQGYGEAMNNLGYLVEYGLIEEETPKTPDVDRAVTLYHQAATKGNAAAKGNLQRLAEAGNTAAKDACGQLHLPLTSTPQATTKEDGSSTSGPKKPVSSEPSKPNPAEELKAIVTKLQADELNDAIDGLQAFVEKYPRSDIAWGLLGMALAKKDMPDEAEEAYDRAIRCNARSTQPYLGKAMLLDKQKRYHEAAEALEAAFAQNPKDVDLLIHLCQAENKAKRYRDLAKYGELAWAKKQNKTLAFHLAMANYFLANKEEQAKYAQAYQKLGGNVDKLKEILAQAEKLHGDKEKLMAWFKSTSQKGNREKAIEQAHRYLSYDPNAVEIWVALGAAYMGQKDYPRAIEMLRMANYLKGDFILFQQKLAEALLENGQYEKAMAEYRKTMKQFPKEPSTYSLAAWLALKMNQPDEAIRLGEKAWELNPNDPVTAARLVVVYHYTDQPEKRDEFRKKAETLSKKSLDFVDKLFKMHKYQDGIYYGNQVLIDKIYDRVKANGNYYFKHRVGYTVQGDKLVHHEPGDTKPLGMEAVLKECNWRNRQLRRAAEAYLEKYPQSFTGWALEGILYDDPEDFEKAMQCYDKAIAINPDYAAVYLCKGLDCILNNRRETAIANIKKAFEKRPELLQEKDMWYGPFLLKTKLYQDVAEFNEILWEVDKTHAWIPAQLVVTYHRLGDIEKRDKYLGHARALGYEDIKTLEKMIAEEPVGQKKESAGPKKK